MSTAILERHLLSLREVAARLHYSERTIRRLIEQHGLPALQLSGPGSAIRIPADELEDWLEERRAAT
jgi:excisionase family DNA binding protein